MQKLIIQIIKFKFKIFLIDSIHSLNGIVIELEKKNLIQMKIRITN